METAQVPIHQKVTLTIKEAAAYFNIGEKKLRQIANENLNSGFVLQNGVKILIKRERFEEYINEISSI